MTLDIEKIEAAALAATQGEWVVSDHIYASDGKRIASYQMISRDDCENEANATHIATANPSAVLELIEKYKALEAENERLKPRHEAYVKMLGELLAVLHADGGHYQYEHGTEKAVEDSITKHYELKRQLAELTEWNNQIGRTNYELRKQLEGEIKQLKDQGQSEYSRGWAEALVIAAQLCHNEAKLKLAQDILNLVERKNT